MDKKALANLRAARILVAHALCDSATSRAYYAAYLAGWAWLARHGEEPPRDEEGRQYWPHSSFGSRLFEWGALKDLDQLDDFDLLRSRRVKADYYREELPLVEAEEALSLAQVLADQLLERKP